MTDIVERLRKLEGNMPWNDQIAVFDDAADTITTLRAEVERLTGERDRQYDENVSLIATNERLRAALEPFAKAADGFDTQRIKNPEEWFAYGGVSSNSGTVGAITVGDLRRARAALAQEKHNDP